MIKKKKKKSRYDPQLHALRSEEEEQRWRCGGAKTISPLSMRVCVCLNFENNDTKKASKIMESSITKKAREFMESSRKKKKREENERAGELLESSGSKGKKRKEERMRELLESGSKEKEKGEDVLMDNGIRVWWTKCKRKKREKEKGNVWRKGRQRIRNYNLKILP